VSARAIVNETNIFLPLDFEVDNPCNGETVHVTGDIHFLVHTVETSSGMFQLHFQSQPAGVSGVGETTGLNYQFSGKNAETRNDVPAGFTDTFIANMHVISQGQTDNLDSHSTIHFTLNANGVVRAQVTNINFACRG
jgi:hypothetical protein